MGNQLNSQVNVPDPATIHGAHPMKDPSFDPNFGFPNGRKERGLLILKYFVTSDRFKGINAVLFVTGR